MKVLFASLLVVELLAPALAVAANQEAPVIYNSNRKMVFHPSGQFLYAIGKPSGDEIAAYHVDPATGAISKAETATDNYIRSGIRTNGTPTERLEAIDLDPRGDFLYATNVGESQLITYMRDGDSKKLNLVTQQPNYCFSFDDAERYNSDLAVEMIPRWYRIPSRDADHKFAYLVCGARRGAGMTGLIQSFFVTNGVPNLTFNKDDPKTTRPEQHIAAPTSTVMAIDPSGQYAYIADPKNNKLNQYRINGSSGQLTALSPAAVATKATPTSITFDPAGKNVYVVNARDSSVSQYQFDPTTGQLKALDSATVNHIPHPEFVYFHPSGKFAYVLSFSNSIYQYKVDAATGQLSPLTHATWSTATEQPIAVDTILDAAGENIMALTPEQVAMHAFFGLNKDRITTTGLIFDPSGKRAYISQIDGIAKMPVTVVKQLHFDPVSGVLSEMPNS